MTKKPILSFQFYNVTEVMQEDIKQTVEKNIEGKLDDYLNKIYKSDDVELRIDYKVDQNKKNKYEGSFRFSYDGKMFVYKNKVGFKYAVDLVNHAFQHFKESLSK